MSSSNSAVELSLHRACVADPDEFDQVTQWPYFIKYTAEASCDIDGGWVPRDELKPAELAEDVAKKVPRRKKTQRRATAEKEPRQFAR